MNKYVVAFLSMHDGELLQEIVEAESKYAACKSYLDINDADLDLPNMECIYNYAANTDCWISVIQINNLPRSGRQGFDLQNRVAELDSQSAVH